MVSRCLRGSSLLGACLEKTEREREDHNLWTFHHIMLCHIVSPHFSPYSKSHSLSFFALMWPEVEQRGTICNPSVQIFTQRDESTCVGQKKRVQSLGLCLWQSHIQLWAQSDRGVEWGGEQERKDEREENEKVGQFRLRDGNQKKEDRWTGRRVWGQLQSGGCRSLASRPRPWLWHQMLDTMAEHQTNVARQACSISSIFKPQGKAALDTPLVQGRDHKKRGNLTHLPTTPTDTTC